MILIIIIIIIIIIIAIIIFIIKQTRGGVHDLSKKLRINCTNFWP